ncbi:hypothetical protein [Leptolyngbya sp. 'hensonii']|uniref:hypothetical protein n=1 Tax=Leptolyngbya sp. 'hensonii' TaxID=1922337 RepID=UPI00094F5313|nr:hypothetical protein [Leptolyngbya sp. 'hensonii']
MAEPINNGSPTDSEPVKVTASARLDRIRKIIQAAAVQTIVEFKAGSEDFRTIAVETLRQPYQALRQRLQSLNLWYDNLAAQAQSQEVTHLEQKQAELESKVGDVGAAVAQQEQRIRQRVKQFLQVVAARL